MEGVLVDTDVLIDVEKGKASLPRTQLFISWISLYEFLRGRRDFEAAKERMERVFTVLPPMNDVLKKAIEIYRDLKIRGEMIDERDLIVAATAISNGLPLLTRNRKHYERLLDHGLVLV
ncbi:MAG: type II toxin-antitoxin system VapC family toxin [Candidatus Korarchaeota archaeon NZ13-K]|nr:MAG: type II toxin-antitoxin system VapC family toxin [Candidatus Korarchaeota archaeon NZ13-K]